MAGGELALVWQDGAIAGSAPDVHRQPARGRLESKHKQWTVAGQGVETSATEQAGRWPRTGALLRCRRDRRARPRHARRMEGRARAACGSSLLNGQSGRPVDQPCQGVERRTLGGLD